MKKLLLSILSVLFCSFLFAQTTVALRLNANEEDAEVDNYNSANNYPSEIDMASNAWTINGTPVTWRSFFKFNLNYIPSNATIQSAYLNLYYATQNSWGGGDTSLTNSNQSVVQRVTSPWSETGVTWNNQPTSTNQDEVILPQSTSSTQDYLGMDVTAMVQAMFANNQQNNFGFLLKLTNETPYARLIFATGDNPDSTEHPELIITYTTPCPVLAIAEDAVLDDYNPGNTNPYSIEYCSAQWTIFGTPVTYRNFFKFNFSSIPSNAIIQSATMNLFYAPNNLFYGNDTSLTNSNQSVLQRVVTPWSETTATWNTQPTTTNLNEVILPQSTSGNQDYINIDVTAMVQDMFANPSTSFGFRLNLTLEQFYARLFFASSNNPVSYMHPQLQLCYTLTSVVENNCDPQIKIQSNSSNKNYFISWNSCNYNFKNIEVLNCLGQTVKKLNIKKQNQFFFDMSAFRSGVYFIKLTGDKTHTQKMLLE